MNEEEQKDLEVWNENWKKLVNISDEFGGICNILLKIKAKDLDRRNIKPLTLHRTYSNIRLVKQINRRFYLRIDWWHEFKMAGPLGVFYILFSLLMVRFSNLKK